MSIQWTFVAAYLYVEVALVIVLISPMFSSRKWYEFFQSRLFLLFRRRISLYFYGLLGILSLFLMDSIREMRKYSIPSESSYNHLASEMKGNVKLFRSQRNFYISGFAIFLSFVIRRLIKMIIVQYELERAEMSSIFPGLDNKNEKFLEIKSKLEKTEALLKEQKIKNKQLEEDSIKWRLKCEEAVKISKSRGDN